MTEEHLKALMAPALEGQGINIASINWAQVLADLPQIFALFASWFKK